jgi:hypothetical protein
MPTTKQVLKLLVLLKIKEFAQLKKEPKISPIFSATFSNKKPSKSSRNGEVSPHLVTLITDYLAEAKKHCSLRTETSYLLFRIGKPLRKYSFAPNVELKF